MTELITISAVEADPPIIQLGLACGLLQPVPGQPGNYGINPDWFTDPVGKTGTGLTENPETLAALIAGLIGDMSGSAMGIPIKEPGSLGTWYPINKPGTDVPSGLFLATQSTAPASDGVANGAEPRPEAPTVFGVGVMYTKTVSLSADDLAAHDLSLSGPSEIELKVWGLIPVLLLGDGKIAVVAGSAERPFTIGFEVTGGGGAPLVTAAGLSFGGVRASLNLAALGDPPVSVSLVVLQLKLPTDTRASDRTLADLEAITGAEILSTAAALAVSALGKLTDDPTSLGYLLPALGLGPDVPGVAGLKLPILRWDLFVENAINDGNLAQPFIDWFTALSSDGKLLSAWLQAVGGVIGSTTPTVVGTGTRADPFRVAIFAVDKIGTLELTGGTMIDPQGVRHFYPGLSFASDPAGLGNSDVALTGSADAEFLDFALCSGGTKVAPGQFRIGLTLGSTTQSEPLFSGEIGGGTYSFGAFNAGMTLSIAPDGGVTVLPVCALISVKTPSGTYPSINLTQPSSLVDAAEEVLTDAIGAVFNGLFGLNLDNQNGAALAALVGIAPPPGMTGKWPADLAPPFSVGQLIDTVQHPGDALGAYWAGLILSTQQVAGQPPFYHMVAALGTVLQEIGGSAVTGNGTPLDPWAVSLGTKAGEASLLVSIADGQAAGSKRLNLGLGARADIPIADNILSASFHVDMLGLDTGAVRTDGLVRAQILPSVGFVGTLPKGLSTPEVSGAQLKVDTAALSVAWSPNSSWHWSMSVTAPTLIVDGVSELVGAAMNYSDRDGLESLVKDQARTFASILTGVLGIALYRAEKRGGLALNAWLGLLPNLGPFVPKGVDWPADMPASKPDSFDDPVGQLRAQIKAVLGSDNTAQAALGLLGWAIDGAAQTAVPIAGAGTMAAPYLLPLGLPGGILGSLWQDTGKTIVVPGLATRQSATLKKIVAQTTVRLDPVTLDWAEGKPFNGGGQPGITMKTVLSGANGPLAAVNGTTVESVTLGVELWLDLSKSPPQFKAAPVLSAQTTDTAGTAAVAALADDLDIAATAALLGWVNAGITQAAEAFAQDDTFKLVYSVLSRLGLAVPATGTTGPYGIDPGGWQALLADPLGYLTGVVQTALADRATRVDLLAAVMRTLGLTLPKIPEPLLALLAGLGLVTDAASGHAPNPQAIIAVLRNPADELKARVTALASAPAARSAVVGAMSKGNQKLSFGPLEVNTANGRLITLTLPRGSLPLGTFADPSMSFQIDVLSGVLSSTQELFIPDAGFSLSTVLSYSPGDAAPEVGVSLVWGDGKTPQPQALGLYPFDSQTFIDQLAVLGPSYVLAIFVAEVIDDKLLADYPVAQSLLGLFGLAAEDPETKAWQMKSTLGLFDNPLGWLLSDAVIGAEGRLNMAALNKSLTTLPGGTLAGLTLRPATDGVQLTGLPYGLQVSATASPQTGIFALTPGLGKPMAVAGGDVTLDALSFGLSLTADFQPGLTGSGRIVAKIPGLDGGLFLSGGYDAGFSLTLGQVGDGNPVLDLIPFRSWQTFVLTLAAETAQKLLQTLTDQLLTGLKEKGDVTLAAFVDSLRTTAESLQIETLVSALIAAGADSAKLETAAFDWLNDRLLPENATATASAVAGLLSVELSGVSSEKGLLTYAPSPQMPIRVLVGLNDADEMGIWATLGVSVAGDNIVIDLAPTGVGIPVHGDPTPNVTFGLTVRAVVADDEGPGLTVSFDTAGGAHVSASIDPMMTQAKASDLKVELLPVLFSVAPPTAQDETSRTHYEDELLAKVEAWLLDVLKYVLPRYVSIIVLNTRTVETWLDAPIADTIQLVPGTVLTDTQLLIKDGSTYILNDLDTLSSLGVEGFLAGFLKALTETKLQILSFGTKGGIWLEPGPDESYGIRFAIPDLAIKAAPNFVFQLGAEDNAWIGLTGAEPTDYESGVAAYVPITGTTPHFDKMKLRLINIGVDFQGKAGAPLLDLSRFKIGKVKPRGLITFDFAAADVIDAFGGSIDVENLAISLAPNSMVSGPHINPVAQNLLGSGDSAAVENPAANPAFSTRAAWINRHDLGVQLYDSSGTSDTKIWIPVQRSFGPVHANKIGIGWDNPKRRASVLFDGSLSLAGLTVDLVDLSVSVNISDITNYEEYALDLDGLAVSFKGGSVEISGGLLRQEDPLSYDGQILIKAASFSLYAAGSFAMIPVDKDNPAKGNAVSFFVFLNLNVPLGGVPAFFVNGVAGGLAINRNINVPDAGDIMSFPLIQGAISASTFEGNDTPAKALGVLGKTVYPEIGAYWLAAGVKFTSFELVDAFVMLLVKFGREFEIDVIGVASASLPPEVPKSVALAYIELAIVASFKFTEGEISVTAQLTPNSFLLAKDCKLTGGFAVKFWFGPNPNSGNFVITLGGYHPAFIPPEFYPQVPRLGFDWPILDTSSVKIGVSGGTYFALTPSMIMAGGYLKAAFSAGPLKAWFDAGADFLISWQPFFYRADVYISVGASLGMTVLGVDIKLTIELGAKLQLWGPPTAGLVEVNWFVISFSIPIGDQTHDRAGEAKLTWDQFQKRMLPQTKPDQTQDEMLIVLADASAPVEPGANQVALKIDVTRGLLKNSGDTGPVVQSMPFTIEIRSVMPASTMTVTDSVFDERSPELGIQPMGQTDVTIDMTILLQAQDDKGEWGTVLIDRRGLNTLVLTEAASAALWTTRPFDPEGKPNADVIPGAVFGMSLSGTGDDLQDVLSPMDLLKSFGYEQAGDLPLPLDITPVFPNPGHLAQDNRFAALMGSVMATGPATLRAAIMQAVEDREIAVIVDQDLSVLAMFADKILQAPPSLAKIGFDQADTVAPMLTLRAAPPQTEVPLAAAGPGTVTVAPHFVGGVQTFATERSTAASGTASIYLTTPRVTARWRDAEAVRDGVRMQAHHASDEDCCIARLRPGAIAVLDAGAGSGLPQISTDGSVPIRVYAFDASGRILSDTVHPTGSAKPPVPLPEKTERVACVGMAHKDGSAPVGWNLHSTLIQVGHHTLLGDGCTVRAQNSPRLHNGMREQKRGPISGGALVDRNIVQTGTGQTAAGWTETIFGTTARTVALVLKSGAGTATLRVKVAATASPWHTEWDGLATPVARFDTTDGTVLLFDTGTEQGNLGPDMRHAVLVSGTDALAGVYAWHDDVATVEAGFGGYRMSSFAPLVPTPAEQMRARRASMSAQAPETTIRLSRG